MSINLNPFLGLMPKENKMEPQAEYKNKQVGIVRKGEQIVLPAVPAPMHEITAIEYLQRKLAHDETTVSVREEIDCHPLEGAWALKKVLEQKFGWAESTTLTKPGLFGPKEVPPEIMTLEVDYQKYEQVLWGGFTILGVQGKLQCGAQPGPKGFMFVIQGQIKKKSEDEVKQIAEDVRNYIRKHSLYRSKPIVLKTNEEGQVDFMNPPTFLDLSKVNEEELIFSDDLQRQVTTNLYTPIEQTAACRKHKIPLKRGILLEGRYGTGKTLAAYVAGKKAIKPENGWTFIYLDRVSGLDSAIEFAKRYEPAVIFAEDIDRTMSGERDVEVDDILNTIDGIGSKNRDIMVVLTTNDVNSIEKAMLRPGRLDAVISFSPPDAKAAEKLIRLYARGLLAENEDLSEAGKELAGQIPAVIREVVERSKLYAISHAGEGALTLTGKDIATSARGMKRHLELLENKAEEPTLEHQLGEKFKIMMTQTLKDQVDTTRTHVKEIHDHMFN